MSAAATDVARTGPDPRPVVVEDAGRHLVAGARCLACGHALARRVPRCTRCRGPVAPERFGPGGRVWAATVVHVPAEPGGEVPYALAYVDLDDGPRVLVRLVPPDARPTLGDRIRLAAPTPAGNATAEVVA